jgi:hypothetical protein
MKKKKLWYGVPAYTGHLEDGSILYGVIGFTLSVWTIQWTGPYQFVGCIYVLLCRTKEIIQMLDM